MNIVDASNELYDSLKGYHEVLGTSVQKRNNVPYIIIYLAKASKAILNRIPSEYRGNKVKTEITGEFYLQSAPAN